MKCTKNLINFHHKTFNRCDVKIYKHPVDLFPISMNDKTMAYLFRIN